VIRRRPLRSGFFTVTDLKGRPTVGRPFSIHIEGSLGGLIGILWARHRNALVGATEVEATPVGLHQCPSWTERHYLLTSTDAIEFLIAETALIIRAHVGAPSLIRALTADQSNTLQLPAVTAVTTLRVPMAAVSRSGLPLPDNLAIVGCLRHLREGPKSCYK
jgi:hypothetical protein